MIRQLPTTKSRVKVAPGQEAQGRCRSRERPLLREHLLQPPAGALMLSRARDVVRMCKPPLGHRHSFAGKSVLGMAVQSSACSECAGGVLCTQ